MPHKLRVPRPTRGKSTARTMTEMQRLLEICAAALGSARTLPAHLTTVQRWRAVDAFCAFLWPQEARRVHSVIAQENAEMLEAEWAERVRMAAALVAEYEAGAK